MYGPYSSADTLVQNKISSKSMNSFGDETYGQMRTVTFKSVHLMLCTEPTTKCIPVRRASFGGRILRVKLFLIFLRLRTRPLDQRCVTELSVGLLSFQLQINAEIVPQIRPRSLPFTSLPINFAVFILPVD
jgi:hypothetical protein